MAAMIPCCEMMQADLERKCATHNDRADCPDALITRYRDGSFGLAIHDGGTSAIAIAYCPWCGTQLLGVDPTPGFATPTQ